MTNQTTADLATLLERYMKSRDDNPVTFGLTDQPGKTFLFVCNYDKWPTIHALLLAQEKDTSTPEYWNHVRGISPHEDGDPDEPQWTGDPEILAAEAIESALEYRG